MRKTAQLERKGLWSLKIDDDNNPNDQYEKVVFFLFAPFFFFFFLFAPFSIKGHLVVFANEEQLERNGLQSLEIDDDNSPKLIYGNILSRRVSDLNSCF